MNSSLLPTGTWPPEAEISPVSFWFIPSASEEGWASSQCSGEISWWKEGRKQYLGAVLRGWWGDRLNQLGLGSEQGTINILFLPSPLWQPLKHLKTSILFPRPVTVLVTTPLLKYHGDWTSFLELYHSKSPQLGAFKQEKFILSQFWGPEVWNQAGGRAVLPPKALRTNQSLSLLGSGGSWQSWFRWLVVASLQSLPPPSSLCPPFSLEGCLVLDSGPTLNPGWSHLILFNLIISAETLFPNKVTFTGSEGICHNSTHYSESQWDSSNEVLLVRSAMRPLLKMIWWL